MQPFTLTKWPTHYQDSLQLRPQRLILDAQESIQHPYKMRKSVVFKFQKTFLNIIPFFLFVHGETIDIDSESCFFVFLLFSAGGAAAVFLTTRFTTTNV